MHRLSIDLTRDRASGLLDVSFGSVPEWGTIGQAADSLATRSFVRLRSACQRSYWTC